MQCRRTWFDSWVGKIPWRRDRLPTPISLGFPRGSTGKQSACNAGGLGLIPGLGRSHGEGKGYPRQYSGLQNSMDCIVHGVAKSWTWLRGLRFSDNSQRTTNFNRFKKFIQHHQKSRKFKLQNNWMYFFNLLDWIFFIPTPNI